MTPTQRLRAASVAGAFTPADPRVSARVVRSDDGAAHAVLTFGPHSAVVSLETDDPAEVLAGLAAWEARLIAAARDAGRPRGLKVLGTANVGWLTESEREAG